MDVCVQAFGVTDVFEDPGSEVHEAAVLRQHQARPRVALRHVQGGDRHGSPHLTHNIREVTSGFADIKCQKLSLTEKECLYRHHVLFSYLFKYFWSVFWRERWRWRRRRPAVVMAGRWDGVHGFSCVVVALQGVAGWEQNNRNMLKIFTFKA